jgi:hypothetical protein
MKYTAQQIADKVVRHLRQQGRPSFDEDKGLCMYLAPNGDKCAAGCLFESQEGDEDTQIAHLIQFSPGRFSDLAPHKQLILDLQDVHDRLGRHEGDEEFRSPRDFRCCVEVDWPVDLQEVFSRYGLDPASITEAPWVYKPKAQSEG